MHNEKIKFSKREIFNPFSEVINEVYNYYLKEIDYYLKGDNRGRLELDHPLNFFDNEINEVIDIDVYESSFPKDKGYKIYRNEIADVLLIKFELINECANMAIKDFLNVDDFYLRKINIGRKKKYGYFYEKFLDTVKAPKEYLDKQYSLKYGLQDYQEQEKQHYLK